MPNARYLTPGLSTLRLAASAYDAINEAAESQREGILALAQGNYGIASLFIQEAIANLQRAQAKIALAGIDQS